MKVIVTTADGQHIQPISSSSVMSKPKPTSKSTRFGALKVRVTGISNIKEEKKEAPVTVETAQEEPVKVNVVKETHIDEVKPSDQVEDPKPIETKESEPVKEDKPKKASKKEPVKKVTKASEDKAVKVEVEPQEVVPPEIPSADSKPVKKATKTASKAKVAKGAKVSSSMTSVKSNFIESKE